MVPFHASAVFLTLQTDTSANGVMANYECVVDENNVFLDILLVFILEDEVLALEIPTTSNLFRTCYGMDWEINIRK